MRLLAATVAALLDSDPKMQLVSIKGGDKRNALPREASAVLAVSFRLWLCSCLVRVPAPGQVCATCLMAREPCMLVGAGARVCSAICA